MFGSTTISHFRSWNQPHSKKCVVVVVVVVVVFKANWRGQLGGCFLVMKICHCVSLDVPVEVRINGFYNLLINGNSLELLTLLLTFYQPPGTSKYVYVLFYTMGSRPFLKYHAIFWDY